MHRPAPVAPRPPRRTDRHDPRPMRTYRTTRNPARARRSRPVPRTHVRAARPLPLTMLAIAGDASGSATNFTGRFADRNQRARVLANLAPDRVKLRSLRAPARNQDDRRIVGIQRRDDRCGVSCLRIVDVAHAVNLGDRSQPVRHRLEACDRFAQRLERAAGGERREQRRHGITHVVLAGQRNLVARYDRNRSRIAGDRRVRSQPRRAGTSSPVRGAPARTRVAWPARAYRRAPIEHANPRIVEVPDEPIHHRLICARSGTWLRRTPP